MSIKPVLSFRGVFVGAISIILLGFAAFAFGGRSYSAILTGLFTAQAAAADQQSETASGGKRTEVKGANDDPKQLGANDKFIFGLGNLPTSFSSRRDRILTFETGGSSQELANTNDFEPSWSPDGGKVVFVSVRNGSGTNAPTNTEQFRDIYTMNADGSDQALVGSGIYVGGEAQPSFSFHTNPNDQRIVYVAWYSGYDPGIYTTDIWGYEGPTRLNTDACFEEEPPAERGNGRSRQRDSFSPGIYNFDTPNYSPDNQYIIFGYPDSNDGTHDVYRIDASGSNCIRLYDGQESSSGPTTARYSRDGSRIALYSKGFGVHNLRILDLEPSTGLPVGEEDFTPTNFMGSPVWSPNPGENKIAYLAGDQNPDNEVPGLQIRRIDLDTDFEDVILSQEVPFGLRGFDWGIPTPAAPALSIRINQPHPLLGGTSTTGTVTRSTPAPAGGVTVNLQVYNPNGPGQTPILNLPANSVFIPENQTQGTFQIDAPLPRADYRVLDVYANSPSPNFGQAQATVSVTPARPDLRAISISAPASVAPGATFDLTLSVDNIGQATTGSGWTDSIYFSLDDQFDASDISLSNSPSTGPLAVGITRTRTIQRAIPPSAATTAGQYYLILRVNSTETINEGGRTTNNTAVTPITIELPDLVPEDLVLPPVVQPGVTYPVSWTTRNIGTIGSSASQSRLYYSPDATLGDANDVILQTLTNTALLPNATQNHSTSFNISTVPARADGLGYFYVKVDFVNAVYEGLPAGTGENNNTLTANTPFEYRVADLQVTSTGTPPEVETETAFAMAWTSSNLGNKAAGTFSEQVYFSADNQVGSDVLLGTFLLSGGLAAGASVDRIQNVTIPTNAIPASGNYFVYVKTDSGTQVNEGENETNNTRFQPVNVRRLLRPDLTITNVTGPPTVFFDQTIQVQWTVTNSGQGPTNSPQWTDRLYIATSPTGAGGTTLKNTQSVSALNPGESYTASAIVKIPRGFNGTYYFVVKADVSGDLNEENTTNNLGSSQVLVNVPPLPDLIVETVQAPDEVFGGQEISINYTVRNIGTQDAGVRKDRIYFSRDTTLSTSQDRLVFTSDNLPGPAAGQVSSHISRNRIGTQDPAVYQLARVPSDMQGLWYVFVIADYRDDVYEFTNENNNTNYDSVEPGSPINVLVTPPDLVVPIAPTAPATVASGTSFLVTFTVRNQGAFNAAPFLYHAVYLSTDQTFDRVTDTLLGSFRDPDFFAPGAEHPITINAGLPNCLTNGTYYLFAVADYNERQFEFDPAFDAEANNASPAQAIQLSTLPPDMQVTNFQASPITIPGQSVSLNWTVSNPGGATTRNWYDRISLHSSNPQIGVRTLAAFERIGGLAAGASYSESRSVVLPTYMEGEYFLSVTTDSSNTVPECGAADSNNSTTSSSFTVQNNLPDLVIDSVNAPSTAVVGDSFNVQWAGRNANQAMLPSTPSWTDSVYLSTDQTLSNSDYNIGSAVNNLILAGGQTYTKQIQVTTGNVPAGTYYVLVYADTGRHIYESTGNSLPENNNLRASGSITLTSPAVDLQVGNVSVAMPHHSGTFKDISWTVTNSGSSATLATQWSDYVILSRDSVLDASDITLGYRTRSAALAGGASYTQTANLFIPTGLTGDYSVFVLTDKGNSVVESNNTNNTSTPITIGLTLPPPAELNITNITPPTTISPGGSASFTWTVQNTGSNAVNGKWRDTVYLSRDQFWDASDVLVGIRDLNSQMTSVPAGGGTYSPTAVFEVPPVEEGTYYVIVRTDSQNRIRESNEGNNVTTSILTTTVAITELQLNTPFNTTLGNGAQQFFKYVTNPDETLLFSLITDIPSRANEAFTNFGTIVSRADYDFQSQQPGEGNQENVIPATEQGDYYSMVRTDLIPESFANNFDQSPVKTAGVKSQAGTPVEPQNITVNARILPFSIRTVSPAEAGNAGYATVVIDGAKFQTGATIKLVASGGLEIVPGKFKVFPNRIIALFDLKGKAAGDYDIIVRNPDNQTATLADGFKILAGGGAAEPRVTINGPGSARGGRLRYTVSVSNDGVNDLLLVPIIITMPSQFAYELDRSNHIGDLPEFMPADAVPSQLPQHYEQDGVRVIALFTPVLGSKRTVNVNIDITVPFGFPNFKVTAMTLPPLEEWSRLSQADQANVLNRRIANMGSGTEAQCWEKTKVCFYEFLRSLLFTVISEALPTGCVGAAWAGALAVTDMTIGMIVKGNNATIFDAIGSMGTLIASSLGALAVECLQDGVPWIKLVAIALTSFKAAYDLWDCLRQYYDCLPPPPVEKNVSFPFTLDPNEKIGPKGYGAEAFVPIRQPLDYRINFENVAEAQAPVQIIRVIDTLPPQLDLRTVRLKEIGFKQNRIVIPDNQSFYQNRVQLGADLNNLQADILAGVDLVNNRIFWTIQAIDPQTGDLPMDPFAGLLPPNNVDRDGEGYMIFTVEAKPEYPNRTPINNFATIIFDQNEPIITNTTANLVDSVVPTSQMAPLPATLATNEFEINWAGTDDTDGSGFSGHSVVYSEDGGAYQTFVTSASTTTATFTGRWGKSYRFYSIGRDNAGNVELPPLQPDAMIRILGGDTEADLGPRPNGNDGLLSADDTEQVRRFVAGLDTDFTYNEFQRSDISPRDGGGNGTLSVADIMQARRYVAGLDVKADAAGPNAPSGLAPKIVPGKNAAMLPREIKAERITRVGNQLHVAIRLEAQGDETGLGFGLNFDPAVLSGPIATLGADGGGAVLTLNTAGVAAGKLGVLIDKAPGSPFAIGSKHVLTIVFDVATGAPAETQLTFGNDPIMAEVVDGLAVSLTTTFSPSTISLIGPTAAGVSVAGTVVDALGRPLGGARVTIADTSGQRRTVLTGPFGHFRFDDVEAGRNYSLDVTAKRHVFATRLLSIAGDVTDLIIYPTN
ncbi:MAG: carboxypeptidase regulatory-like domain-containing protein [Pyrinomonadaceae bacterium]|nr:carboxypeptidase regulatory-like domain-containing protein [Pyrinomonadaceae bacterium]MBP6214055.1 carboxypeptidase regulatory-like domain-containing protein [Pyrinomonadaceae bacterium]